MEASKRRGGILWGAVFATLLWGSAFPSVKVGYSLFGIDASATFCKLVFAGWRFLMAGLAVLLFARLRGVRDLIPTRKQVPGVIVMALLQTGVQYACFYIGLAYTSGSKGAMITGSAVFASVIGAHFLFPDDRLTPIRAVGCIIGFSGVVLVNLGGSLGGFSLVGDGLMALSAICTGLATPYCKRLTNVGMSPFMVTGWQMTLGGGMLLLLGLLGGGSLPQVSPAGIALMAWLVFVSAAGFSIWTLLVKKYPASSRVAVYNFLVPVFGTLLSGIFLHEKVLSLQNLCALALVSGGILLANRSRKPV